MSHFDKSTIRIVVPAVPGLELRAATGADLESLRHWKNEQRRFFFFQEEITKTQQKQWFDAFMERSHDLMLMTMFEEQVFGCMGIRWQGDLWDIYNVILGLPDFGKRGLMRHAFAAMLDYAIALKPGPITLKVLKRNPAVDWYKKHGFRITESHEQHFSMSYKSNSENGL